MKSCFVHTYILQNELLQKIAEELKECFEDVDVS